MAIVDGVKNAVTSQVAARANKSIRAGLTKVAGNLLGINTQYSGPQLGDHQPRAERFRSTRYTTENLMYPLDVEEDPQQGHYILFNINEHDPAAIEARAEAMKEMREHEKAILAQYKAEKKSARTGGALGFTNRSRSLEEVRADYIREHVIEGYDSASPLTQQTAGGSRSRHDSSSINLRYPATKRLKTAISLYMPPSVQVQYGAQYNDAEIGALAGIASEIITDFRQGDGFSRELVTGTLDEAGSGAKRALLALLDVAAPGAKAIAQIQTGRAITPKLELMFNGMGRREFSYEFSFIPKNPTEAEMVKRIVYQFKYHMAADYIEGTAYREMSLPSTFDIAYYYSSKETKELHRISTCALESVDVSYGGDRFLTYVGGVPQQTKLTLKFKEMEIITKSRIKEGY